MGAAEAKERRRLALVSLRHFELECLVVLCCVIFARARTFWPSPSSSSSFWSSRFALLCGRTLWRKKTNARLARKYTHRADDRRTDKRARRTANPLNALQWRPLVATTMSCVCVLRLESHNISASVLPCFSWQSQQVAGALLLPHLHFGRRPGQRGRLCPRCCCCRCS